MLFSSCGQKKLPIFYVFKTIKVVIAKVIGSSQASPSKNEAIQKNRVLIDCSDMCFAGKA